jgi:hypothetical protein
MFHRIALIIVSTTLAACGEPSGDDDAAPPAAQPQAAQPAASAPQLTRRKAPEGAAVYIISPTDGEQVQTPFRVVFGLRGAGVVPAGIERPDAGHHHLLIDADVPPLGAPIPADDRHRHFGLGQTETELSLPPGEHRLQLLLGDHLHVPHDPPLLSEPVSVLVVR